MRLIGLALNALFLVLLLLVVYRVARSALMDIDTGRESAPAPGSHLRRLDDGSIVRLRPFNTIGRDAECDIVIDDSFTSSKHATLSWSKGRWRVIDLGSTNGTLIGKEKVMAAELSSGEHITFGRTQYVLEEK